MAEQARKHVKAGFTALKMNATGELERIDDPAAVDAAATRLREVREAVGDDVGVDFHGCVSKPMAKRLVAVADIPLSDDQWDRIMDARYRDDGTRWGH